MKLPPALALDAPAPAAAPPAVELPPSDCRHPVRVIDDDCDGLLLGVCGLDPADPPLAGGCCAATPTASAALSIVPNIN
jgi:hypothetical protein